MRFKCHLPGLKKDYFVDFDVVVHTSCIAAPLVRCCSETCLLSLSSSFEVDCADFTTVTLTALAGTKFSESGAAGTLCAVSAQSPASLVLRGQCEQNGR